jgi:phage-related protein
VPNWELVFYETSSGRSPVRDFIANLPTADEARVLEALDDLELHGVDLQMPRVRRLSGSALWELRVRGPNQQRIMYVTITGRRIILLHGFQKQSRATPRREIETAEQRLADYRRRLGQ